LLNFNFRLILETIIIIIIMLLDRVSGPGVALLEAQNVITIVVFIILLSMNCFYFNFRP